MNDLFQKLHNDHELPEDLKKEVMKSYDTFKLVADISDLFTDKFFKSTATLFSGESSEDGDSSQNRNKKSDV
ncbi:MAG: hypothetical protein CMO01_11740 [Thalassobius sp.]|nr:hypothetical protein [Thalassovita sp.]